MGKKLWRGKENKGKRIIRKNDNKCWKNLQEMIANAAKRAKIKENMGKLKEN